MHSLVNLQQIKEQLKIKSLELKKIKEEKENSINNLSELIANNRLEINNLKAIIKKNEEDIDHHRSLALRSRISNFSEQKDSKEEDLEKKQSINDKKTPLSNSLLEPLIIKKIKSLKDQTQFFKKQFESEKQNNILIQKENGNFQEEVNRLRTEIKKTKILKERIGLLQSQLKEAKNTTLSTKLATVEIVEKKKILIKKYEKYLYGDAFSGKKGTPPSAIIIELKNDLEKLEAENKQKIQEMEFLQEENSELESKILFLEEKELSEIVDYKPDMENRVTVTAEFSSGLESFLVTYSDLITLILVIFVLLYSISRVDPEKFSDAFSSFQEQEMQYDSNNVQLNSKELQMLKRVRELVKDNVDPESLVRSDVRTVLIRLKSSDLFTPGSAELIPGAGELIFNSIQEDMQDGVKQVHVDGHTDDVPMRAKDKFPTNWELSSVRASHVARVIIDKLKFSPDRMVVTGYGQYRPIKPNNSDSNRAMNRRVEIKILKDIKVIDENTDFNSTKNQKAVSGLKQNLPTSSSAVPEASPQIPWNYGRNSTAK